MTLAGKVTLVTGSSQSLGQGIVLRPAETGAASSLTMPLGRLELPQDVGSRCVFGIL